MLKFEMRSAALTKAALCMVLGLAPALPASAALLIDPRHTVSAATSVSAISVQSESPIDGAVFDRGALSAGGTPGAISSALASQSVLFEARHGASGSGDAALELSPGHAGFAFSELVAVYDLSQRSSFSVEALFSTSGSALADAELSLTLLSDSGSAEDFVDIFRYAGASQKVSRSGFLDPGLYRFTIQSGLRDDETGAGAAGFSRFDFNFRFDELPGDGNATSEPSSLALALAAAFAAAWRRRAARATPRAAAT